MVSQAISFKLAIAQICFNYLQQQFYLVTPSMKALAKGKNEEVVLKLLKNLVGATQGVSQKLFENKVAHRTTTKPSWTMKESEILQM